MTDDLDTPMRMAAFEHVRRLGVVKRRNLTPPKQYKSMR